MKAQIRKTETYWWVTYRGIPHGSFRTWAGAMHWGNHLARASHKPHLHTPAALLSTEA